MYLLLFSGDLSRTFPQTFDCIEKTYLKFFNKSDKLLNSTYGCQGLNSIGNSTDFDQYEAVYNGADSNNRARANWRDFHTNIQCQNDSYLCGLDINMEGKFKEISEDDSIFQEFALNNQVEEITTLKKLNGEDQEDLTKSSANTQQLIE